MKVMKEERRLLRIGDVAAIIRVPIHTLRYWENMFQEVMSPGRSEGGQRRYCERDIEKIRGIKRLLKEEGYSIAGAKRILKSPLSSRGRALNWSDIAQEVTELIREKLSEEIDQVY